MAAKRLGSEVECTSSIGPLSGGGSGPFMVMRNQSGGTSMLLIRNCGPRRCHREPHINVEEIILPLTNALGVDLNSLIAGLTGKAG